MKWFQHDGNALGDPKLEKLMARYGIIGYGVYFACVEIIAGRLSPECFTFELEHDSEILDHKFQMRRLLWDDKPLSVESIIVYCLELELFELNEINNRIRCSKLAIRLDNTLRQEAVKNPEIRKILDNYKRLLQETSSNLKHITLHKSISFSEENDAKASQIDLKPVSNPETPPKHQQQTEPPTGDRILSADIPQAGPVAANTADGPGSGVTCDIPNHRQPGPLWNYCQAMQNYCFCRQDKAFCLKFFNRVRKAANEATKIYCLNNKITDKKTTAHVFYSRLQVKIKDLYKNYEKEIYPAIKAKDNEDISVIFSSGAPPPG